MKLAIIFLAALLVGTFAYPQSSGGKFRSGKVVGGTNATEGEFPFHVNLEFYFINDWFYYCAGVLIDDRTILTSASAVLNNPFQFRAIAGDFNQYDVSGNEQIRTVVNMVPHPDFDQESRNNDLAILTVDPPFIFNQYVQPLRLAEAAFGDPQGEVVSIGYGEVDNEAGAFLLKATMNVIEREACDDSYAGYDYPVPLVSENMVCARAPSAEICGSDVGGALIGKDVAGRQYLVGTASWGAAECVGYPSVFTNIAELRGWVDATLNP